MLKIVGVVWDLIVKFPIIPIIAILFLCATLTFPVFSTIGGWLGFETKASLKKENTVLVGNNAVLTEANKANTTAVAIATDDTKITNEVLSNNDEGKKVIDRKVTKIDRDTAEKINVIEASSATEEEKVYAKSQERALSVWKTYCSFNNNPDCAAIVVNDAEPVSPPKEKQDVSQIEPDVDRFAGDGYADWLPRYGTSC